jgi:AcrR family transcriptional regulator
VVQRTYTKRRAQAAATREQLLQAAHVIFDERGYQAATVGAITQRANTAHGTFYLYFKNKDEAFLQVVESVMLDVHDRALSFSMDGDLRSILERALRGFLEVFAANRGIWRSLLEGALTTPAIAQAWGAIREGFHHRVARLLDELQAQSLVRPLDSERTAAAIGAMGEWMTMSQLVFGTQGAPDVEQMLETMIDVWHPALAAAGVVVD